MTSMDDIINNKMFNKVKKITKLMQKASANVTHLNPLAKVETMDLITGIYAKKLSVINTSHEIHFEFDDFVY